MTLPGVSPELVSRAQGGPSARLLSNGELTSLVTAEGSGFLQLGARRITSWTPDPVEDREGVLLYLRDDENGALWSLGRAPVAGAPARYLAAGAPGRVRIERSERGIEALCEITVAADANVELRRIRLRNTGERERRLTLTS
jgi:cellobiose phosphorylase